MVRLQQILKHQRFNLALPHQCHQRRLRKPHAYGDSNCHIRANRNADCDGYIYAYRNGNADGNIHANGYGNCHRNRDSHGNCDRIAAGYTHATASADAGAASEQLLFR